MSKDDPERCGDEPKTNLSDRMSYDEFDSRLRKHLYDELIKTVPPLELEETSGKSRRLCGSILTRIISEQQGVFGLDLSGDVLVRLAKYYTLILEHNPLLHLVARCTNEEFAIRHILESLTLLEHLPDRAKFADVGPGGGLPSIPCLLARDDLSALMIESKEKKARFLGLAIESLGLSTRAQVVNRQFTEVGPVGCTYVTCRALDKFTERLPALLRWAKRRPMLLFGGNNLRDALQKSRVNFVEKLMPLSEQRFLFMTKP